MAQAEEALELHLLAHQATRDGDALRADAHLRTRITNPRKRQRLLLSAVPGFSSAFCAWINPEPATAVWQSERPMT